MTVNPSIVALFAFVISSISMVIWWIIRKKRNRVWLPTLRLIKEESNPLPKIRFVPPPLIVFLCFLGTALSILFLSFEPSKQQYRDVSSKINKIHVYIDLSPSMEISLNSDERTAVLQELYQYFGKQGTLSFSTSYGEKVHLFKNEGDFLNWASNLKVHRAGLKLGKGVHKQLENIGSIDRLVIVSDFDKYSWSDFNWQYLKTKMDVVHAPIVPQGKLKNIYIDQAEILSEDSQSQSVWKVKVSRNYSDQHSQGILKVNIGKTQLTESSFEIPKGHNYAEFEVQWPWDKWVDLKGESAIEWKIEASSGNDLKIDDLYRTKAQGKKRDLLIVSEPEGEMFLEDPIRHLKISLDVLGFRAKREDVFIEKEVYWDLPLWILAAGDGPVEQYCPSSYEIERLRRQRSAESVTPNSSLPIIWLMPKSQNVSYKNMCWCYSKLIVGDQENKGLPTYCDELETRDQYISVLQSLGAQQIGGTVSNTIGSFAWHRKRPESGAEVLAFTVPLKPSKLTGVSYDMLPTLTKTFLQLSYVVDGDGKNRKKGWPRYTHIGDRLAEDKLLESNVPRGESSLTQIEDSAIPPKWQGTSGNSLSLNQGVREEDDPRPWIEMAYWIIVGLAFLEGGWLIIKAIRRNSLKSSLLVFCILIPFGDDLRAAVKVHLIGYPDGRYRGETLARDVSGRTSITLDPKISLSPDLKSNHLSEPWLWVYDKNQLRLNDSKQKNLLERWIKRGGLLLVENERKQENLVNLLDLHGGKWQAIPPDHEVMRSFHLLDSLPKCKGNVWMGYYYDDRIAVVASPYGFMQSLLDPLKQDECAAKVGREQSTRIFINLLMVALATDYKKDQIHLPEILKRLR